MGEEWPVPEIRYPSLRQSCVHCNYGTPDKPDDLYYVMKKEKCVSSDEQSNMDGILTSANILLHNSSKSIYFASELLGGYLKESERSTSWSPKYCRW